MILMTGATGSCGRRVISRMPRTGTAVRALTGNLESAGLSGDVVRGDLSIVGEDLEQQTYENTAWIATRVAA
jgi:uncharacterized protein YbjT (DUF2867 family)